jgi:thiosulfate reductase cytochrome b subunit
MSREHDAYPLWLRCWHWINAGLFLALLVTGLSIHWAAPGTPAVKFRTAILAHNTAGILLTASYVWFLLGLVRGNGRYYRLTVRDIVPGMFLQARHYLLGIFRGEPSPFPHDADRKFNPLQKMSYLVVMFALFPALIATGWALFFPADLPARVLDLPGVGIAAIAHTYLAFVLSLFMVVHVYLGTTGRTPGELFRLMLVGDRGAHAEPASTARPSNAARTPPPAAVVPVWQRDQPWIVLLTSHWLTMLGLVLGITAVCTWLFTLPSTLPGAVQNPYKGAVLYLILPFVLVGGLVLAAIGLVLGRRRIQRELPAAIVDTRTAVHRLLLFLAVTIAVNLLVGTQLTYRAVVYMDTPQFCGATCHAMRPEHAGHQDSSHASVSCAECHVEPGAAGWFEAKMNGTRQMFETIMNSYPRPIPSALTSERLVPSRTTCERCHWVDKLIGTRLRVIPSYASDEHNSASYTVLEMIVGGSAMDGIHKAHFAGGYEISYAASDAEREKIQRVERRDLRTGETTTYYAQGMTRALTAAMPRHVMQCVDCHNRPTHDFEPAERALDRALALGAVPATLPFVKKQGLAVLTASYASTADAARKIPAAIDRYYRESHPDVYAKRTADVAKAAQAILAAYERNVFPESGVTWGTYPNHLGHVDSPGCFRCHDGSHTTADGTDTITQDCTACHAILATEESSPKILDTLGLWDKIEALRER